MKYKLSKLIKLAEIELQKEPHNSCLAYESIRTADTV